MQDNSDINALLDDLKKNVLGNQHDDFAGYVKIFIQAKKRFEVDEIKKFIEEHGGTFSNDEYERILFGILKFFLDTAVIQNHYIKIDNVYNLLDKFKDKLSWEQSCDLLMDFLDKDWDKDPNNKNFENAKKLIDDLISYLSKSRAKKVYTSEFSCTQKYFKKIMTEVPKIKTPEYLSYISKKLSETDFPPQFCFEIVWLFGDELLLKTDIKDLGWHAQFARFRLEIIKIAEQEYPRQKFPQIYKNELESNFEKRISDYFYNYQIAGSLGEEVTKKLIGYLKNENVAWQTKFSITNYLMFSSYYDYIMDENRRAYIPYNDLLTWKSMIKKKFESPNDLLNVFAKIFPYIKDFYDKYDVEYYCRDWLYILCFAYSKTEIYQCIKNLENENNDEWKRIFLWKATTYYKKDLVEPQFNITEFFKTPDKFLDNVLKDHGVIGESDAKKIEKIKKVSQNIDLHDLFLYPINEIKSFIEKTDDPNKLVLLFYTISKRSSNLSKIFKSPLDILDIYMELHPKIKNHLKDTNLKVLESLTKSFTTEQLTGALKETNDPEKMILLINALNSYKHHKRIKQIFKNPKDLFDACVKKYKSKEKNIEINDANCKCPQPLLNILKKYDKQELDRFTQYFKEENDPLTKSWLSDLVDVKQNFFETYSNVLDFLNKNKNCPQLIKDNLNGIIKNKFQAKFNANDFGWLLGLESDYSADTKDRDAFIYSENIEERCELILNLFSNGDSDCRVVIFNFVNDALKYHANIWKAVLGLILIIDADETIRNNKNISLLHDVQMCMKLWQKVDQYNLYKLEYNEFDDQQILNLSLQINQILTLNWKWFTIIWTFVYFWQLCSLNKRRSHLTAEKNQLQPFVDRLDQAKKKRESFGLQTNNRDQNKLTPFQYYNKYQARVKGLLDNMQEIIKNPEKRKILNENKSNEEINNNPNIISTTSNNQENKIREREIGDK